MASNIPDRETAYRSFMARKAQYGNMVTSGQRAGAARRRAKAEEKKHVIQWDNVGVWKTPAHDFLVTEMPDQFLWRTVNWAVRQSPNLFEDYGKTHEEEAARYRRRSLDAASFMWLRDRPLFRAMVKEATKRDFTYPKDVFNFIKDFVLNQRDGLGDYTPWKDPDEDAQVTTLRSLRNMPLEPDMTHVGRSSRVIDVG